MNFCVLELWEDEFNIMKKAKIVLAVSLVIFIALIILYIVNKNNSKEAVVSLREQYQMELKENGEN